MRKKGVVLGVVLLVLTGSVVGASYGLAAYVMTGTRQTLDEAMKWQSDRYDTKFYEELEKTDYTVAGYEDYNLHVELLKNPVPTNRYVILSHGYTDNRIGSLKYVPTYLRLGYNCVVYDLRGHGENDSFPTTYGLLESRDLKLLIEDTRQRYPELSVLGLHGESLGAATTLTTLQYKPEVDFVVADCGFARIEDVLRNGQKNAHMPGLIVDLADIGARLRYHYSLKEMCPIEALSDNYIPILFLHGSEDTFIPPSQSEEMCGRTPGEAELHMIEGAGHAESVLVDPDTYEKYVSEFLDKQMLRD